MHFHTVNRAVRKASRIHPQTLYSTLDLAHYCIVEDFFDHFYLVTTSRTARDAAHGQLPVLASTRLTIDVTRIPLHDLRNYCFSLTALCNRELRTPNHLLGLLVVNNSINKGFVLHPFSQQMYPNALVHRNYYLVLSTQWRRIAEWDDRLGVFIIRRSDTTVDVCHPSNTLAFFPLIRLLDLMQQIRRRITPC